MGTVTPPGRMTGEFDLRPQEEAENLTGAGWPGITRNLFETELSVGNPCQAGCGKVDSVSAAIRIGQVWA